MNRIEIMARVGAKVSELRVTYSEWSKSEWRKGAIDMVRAELEEELERASGDLVCYCEPRLSPVTAVTKATATLTLFNSVYR